MKSMQKETQPAIVDWLVLTLRWLALVGLSLSIAEGVRLSFALRLVILVFALWNLFLALLVGWRQLKPVLRWLSIWLDVLVSSLLFYLSSALTGGLGWSGILPMLSAGMSLDGKGLFWVGLVTILVLGVQSVWFHSPMTALTFVIAASLLFILLGAFIHGLSRRVVEAAQRIERERIGARHRAEAHERERRRAIYHLISTLSATLNYQRVLDTALDLSASILTSPTDSSDRLVSAFLLLTEGKSGETVLQVGSATLFTNADMRIQLPGVTGLIGRAIHDGEACLSKNVARDPELGRIVALHACQSAYCIPLRHGLDTYGVLLFAHPEGEYFTQERREILDIVGNQAMVAIQNARLYRDLELEKERILEVQEEARKKLARDLHDGPTQSVAALAMRVNLARRLMERDTKSAAEELFKVEDLARRTTKEIRHMLFTLRPLVLESQGLIAALESMAEKMRETFHQEVIIQADSQVVSLLDLNKQAVLFFIAEEAINNARKHAQAEHIWVRLQVVKEDFVLLEVEDDGVGFDLEAVDGNYELRGSLGLVNMRERAELVNGVLNITSQPGKGTRLQVVIPLHEEAVERLRHGY